MLTVNELPNSAIELSVTHHHPNGPSRNGLNAQGEPDNSHQLIQQLLGYATVLTWEVRKLRQELATLSPDKA